MPYSKRERLDEFLERLKKAPPAASLEEARRLLEDTLNTVEDEMTDIPYNPDTWQTDGRMYPPQDNQVRPVPERSDVKRLQSKGHRTYVRANGAIEIQTNFGGKVILSKPGADGKGVWEP